MRARLRILAAAALVPVLLPAQQPRVLGAPNATFDEPFSQVAGLRELANGRLVVADGRDKILALIDLAAQSTVKIGREGSGPAEYGLPLRVYAAPGDTTFVFDPLNTRYLVVGPDGKPLTTFMMETTGPTGGGGGVRIGGFTMARASDARGRLYAETPPVAMGPNGPATADSVGITRYDRATKKIDTLAWIRLPKDNNTEVRGGNGNMSIRIGGGNPLAPRDEWAVFPDGRVAVVRTADYHVDWVLPNGQKRSTAAVPFPVLRVGEADKREEEALRNRQRANQMSIMMTQGPEGTRRTAQMGPGPDAPPLPPLTDYPATKPPFRQGPNSVFALPNGDLWVRRTEAAGAKGALFDVINAQGAVTHQVRIPDGWNLVGFGNGTVYTTKADEDDLLTLQRHRMP